MLLKFNILKILEKKWAGFQETIKYTKLNKIDCIIHGVYIYSIGDGARE